MTHSQTAFHFLGFTGIFAMAFAGCLCSPPHGAEGPVHWFEMSASGHAVVMAHGDESLPAFMNRLEEEGETVLMVTNGGMFNPEHQPLGLFIENGETHTALNRGHGSGNFSWRPNGVFAVKENGQAFISTTKAWTRKQERQAHFATQSGPMLVIDEALHPGVANSTESRYIRSGVGILPDGQVLFGISYCPISFREFALAFQEKGCKNALYLDGAISQMRTEEGCFPRCSQREFGVMIAVVERPSSRLD